MLTSFFWRVMFGGGRGEGVVGLGLLVLRVWVGVTMAWFYGMGKFPPGPGFVDRVRSMGFPLPELFAWCAVMAEVGGGILIALGLFTRPAALALAFTMLVAVVGVKSDLPFASPDRMNPQHYLVVCLALVLTGAGRWSLDGVLGPRKERVVVR